MDFTLRCNSLKCRAQLTERAVVTTCSHIFCNVCSETLGLTAPSGADRICPACQSNLPNPDDAVSTSLNPTDDYKTSVLSGLCPSTIMECAGRGLAFWSYQSTQEIIFQEYAVKTWTDKYSNLNAQMDRIVHDANSELDVLNHKLNGMQIDQERLKIDNQNLASALREKTRKHQQTQELYNRLRRKEMAAATQSAAFESVDDAIGANPSRPLFGSRNQNHSALQSYPVDQNGIEQVHTHQRSGSNHVPGGGDMMPPPAPRRRSVDSNSFGYGQPIPSPSTHHRTQLGIQPHSANRSNLGSFRFPTGAANRSFLGSTPTRRQPLADVNLNSVNRNGISGYGMSAGLKIGRQQDPQHSGTSQGLGAGHSAYHAPQASQQNHRSGNVYF